MRDKLGAVANYTKISKEKDRAVLLIDIKYISYEYDGQQNPYLALDDGKLKI